MAECPDTSERRTPPELLRHLFDEAVAAAQPRHCVPPALPSPPEGRTIVIGAGKASAAMARAVEDHWNGPLSGLVVTRYGHGPSCERICVREGGHPVPDEAGVAATLEMMDLLKDVTARDLVICLVSGGGSSLLAAPPPTITLEELRDVSRQLLKAGATISEINCVRKHLSLVAGGRLAKLAEPARLVTLAISDVPGDDPATIASGPTVPDPTTRHDALCVLEKFCRTIPVSVRDWLESEDSETPTSGSPMPGELRIIASAQTALDAAAKAASDSGYAPLILGSSIEGEAREVGTVHAGIALQVKRSGQPIRPPCVLLSGGETSVTVQGSGRGGRNGEFLLSLAIALDGQPGIYALAADTDGIDGTEDNAGALIGPDTLSAAAAKGSCARSALASSCSFDFFEAAEALVVTGPTHTNVNDFRAIVIDGAHIQGK